MATDTEGRAMTGEAVRTDVAYIGPYVDFGGNYAPVMRWDPSASRAEVKASDRWYPVFDDDAYQLARAYAGTDAYSFHVSPVFAWRQQADDWRFIQNATLWFGIVECGAPALVKAFASVESIRITIPAIVDVVTVAVFMVCLVASGVSWWKRSRYVKKARDFRSPSIYPQHQARLISPDTEDDLLLRHAMDMVDTAGDPELRMWFVRHAIQLSDLVDLSHDSVLTDQERSALQQRWDQWRREMTEITQEGERRQAADAERERLLRDADRRPEVLDRWERLMADTPVDAVPMEAEAEAVESGNAVLAELLTNNGVATEGDKR